MSTFIRNRRGPRIRGPNSQGDVEPQRPRPTIDAIREIATRVCVWPNVEVPTFSFWNILNELLGRRIKHVVFVNGLTIDSIGILSYCLCPTKPKHGIEPR